MGNESFRIVIGKPACFDRVSAAFGLQDKRGLIMTIGATCWNVDGWHMDEPLIAHEKLHSQRQLAYGDLDGYLDLYLTNPEFRFAEELLAHQEEWRCIKDTIPLRSARRERLWVAVDRLSSPMYGALVTRGEAKRMILGRGQE